MEPSLGKDRPVTYQIKVEGQLDACWSDWFSEMPSGVNGMVITCESQSDGPSITTLTGPVVDQSALRGLLAKIWDLSLTLISVNQV